MTAVIIVFNTDRFLTEQIRLLQKYVTDKIAVIDNSTDWDIARNLKAICEENKADYTKTAVNESDFSKSHAYACTIGIEMFRDKDESLLMLDHDIFPIKQFEPLGEEIILAGIPQTRKSAKHITDNEGNRYLFNYFWPGLLYINTKLLAGHEIDVKPCIVMETFLDTGGGLYKLIHGNPGRVKELGEQHQEFILNDEKDIYALVDNGAWMHFQRGSNWNGGANHEERIKYLMSVLYASA